MRSVHSFYYETLPQSNVGSPDISNDSHVHRKCVHGPLPHIRHTNVPGDRQQNPMCKRAFRNSAHTTRSESPIDHNVSSTYKLPSREIQQNCPYLPSTLCHETSKRLRPLRLDVNIRLQYASPPLDIAYTFGSRYMSAPTGTHHTGIR